MYDYREAVKNDVIDYIKNEAELDRDDLIYNREWLEEKLYEDLWTNDSVTGNGSGSYTFNTYEAEENLLHNWDLLVECANEFGCEPVISDGYENGPEFWDVSIRCYLLGEAISAALDEIEAELETEED